MKTFTDSENAVLIQAERMGYLVQESISLEERYFIVDMHTNIVIAGAQDFLAWEEVVRWVVEANAERVLN